MEIQEEIFKSSLPIQIRFNDIDALGHINNNVYLSYADLGKADYFEALRGYALSWLDGAIVLARIEMDFVKPVFYKEKIAVDTKITRLGDKSGSFLQHIRNLETNEIKCICKSVFVYYDSETASTTPIPHTWREAIAKFEEKEF